MNEGFLGTRAPRYVDLVLLLEIGMGLTLLGGAVLARRKTFSAARILSVSSCAPELCNHPTADASLISCACDPQDTGQTWQGLLFSGDSTRGARRDYRNRSIVRSTIGGHGYFAAAIPIDRLQSMDA